MDIVDRSDLGRRKPQLGGPLLAAANPGLCRQGCPQRSDLRGAAAGDRPTNWRKVGVLEQRPPLALAAARVGSGAGRIRTSLRSNSRLTGKITGKLQTARRARRKKSAPGSDFRPRLAAMWPIGTGNFGTLNRQVVRDYLLRQKYRARGGSSTMRYVRPSTIPAARHTGQRDAMEGNLLGSRLGTRRGARAPALRALCHRVAAER